MILHKVNFQIREYINFKVQDNLQVKRTFANMLSQ
jgi:hypothetical protein